MSKFLEVTTNVKITDGGETVVDRQLSHTMEGYGARSIRRGEVYLRRGFRRRGNQPLIVRVERDSRLQALLRCAGGNP